MRILLGSVFFLTVGCGELVGATETSPDAFFARADTGQSTATSDTRIDVPNDLYGDYYDDLIPQTLAAFRLERRSDPSRPWIVFVSDEKASPITCDDFKPKTWNQELPDGMIIHVVEFANTVPGDYRVDKTSPPVSGFAAVARATKTNTDFKPEYATKGTVSILTWDATSTTGSFNVEFPAYFPADEPDAGPVPQLVQGSFDVTSCAVDW